MWAYDSVHGTAYFAHIQPNPGSRFAPFQCGHTLASWLNGHVSAECISSLLLLCDCLLDDMMTAAVATPLQAARTSNILHVEDILLTLSVQQSMLEQGRGAAATQIILAMARSHQQFLSGSSQSSSTSS